MQINALLGICTIMAGSSNLMYAQAQASVAIDSAQSAVDWDWVYTKEGLDTLPIIDPKARGNWMRTGEPYYRRVRERGLVMFDKYPYDPRRWEWLITSSSVPVYYYTCLPQAVAVWDTLTDDFAILDIDTAAQNAWNREYPRLRAAYLAAFDVPAERRHYFQYNEIRNMAVRMKLALKKNGIKPGWEPLDSLFDAYAELTLAYAAEPQPESWRPNRSPARDLPNFLMSHQEFQQRTRPQLIRLMRRLKTSKNTDLVLYAAAKERLLTQGRTPVDMKFTTVDGRRIDLVTLRGKAVLIDFWDSGCGSCIAAFPKIKDVYNLYHSKGFEVIGVSLDPEENRRQVLKILSEHALPWPQVIVGGTGRDSNIYVRKYQVYGVPEMFLVDRKGRLIADGYITSDELKEYLKSILDI